MIDYRLIFVIAAAFLIPLFAIPIWMKKARQIGLAWDDMNKLSGEKVMGSGGIMAVGGFVIGVLLFVAYRTFYLQQTSNFIQIFATLLVIIMLAGIGFVDDLLGWRKGGLSRRTRLLLVAISSIPLMAINAGKHIISLPFDGQIDLGLFYPLLLIPI